MSHLFQTLVCALFTGAAALTCCKILLILIKPLLSLLWSMYFVRFSSSCWPNILSELIAILNWRVVIYSPLSGLFFLRSYSSAFDCLLYFCFKSDSDLLASLSTKVRSHFDFKIFSNCSTLISFAPNLATK